MTRAQALDALEKRLNKMSAAIHIVLEMSAADDISDGLLQARGAIQELRAQNESLREALSGLVGAVNDEQIARPSGALFAAVDAAEAGLSSEPAGWPASIITLLRRLDHQLDCNAMTIREDKELERLFSTLPASLRAAAKEPSNG